MIDYTRLRTYVFSNLKNFWNFIVCLFSVVLLSLNMWFFHVLWIGLACFTIYAIFMSRVISRHLTFFDKSLVLPFGFLILTSSIALISAIFIGLSVSLSNELLVIVLLFPMLFFLKRKNERKDYPEKLVQTRYPLNRTLFLVFLLSLFGMVLDLWNARTGNSLPYFQSNLNFSFYFFNFIAMISVAIIVLSNNSLRSKLIAVSAYSIVSHLFNYLTYSVIWCSDAWDNLQTSWWIHDGGVLQSSSNIYYFLARGENGYLGLWGINVSTSRITGIDLFSLYPYIGIIAALFVPLILYQIVKLLTISFNGK